MSEKIRLVFNLFEEFHIDATYKTPCTGCELYGVTASVNGTKFHIGCHLLQVIHAANGFFLYKSQELEGYWQSLRERGIGAKALFPEQ